MNQKTIIGALVGGFLVFFWQFLSFALLNLHASEQKHSPNQDKIIECLSSNISEHGTYFIPISAPGTSQEEMQKEMEANAGKPWAIVSYRPSMKTDMTTNMIRGFAVDIVAVLLLIFLLNRMSGVDMKTAIISSVSIGLIGYLTTEYANAIWFEYNSTPDLIDAIVPWVLCGTWLGYWMNR